MESSIFRQIADLAREHKTAARATAVFLCLALVVTAATVGILTHTGQAMTQKVKVLTCTLDVHQHTADCKDETGALVCGYADYVVHIHNDDCYDENGILVCTLPQIAPHTHTAACYGEVKTPICGQEETPPHVHTEACYLRERGELTCTVQEHTHGDECFLRESVLTCDKTEDPHVHTDACYTVTRDLTCGQEEGEEHTHSDACYTENRVLTCDKTVDPHVHTDACYTVNETLTCTIPEHTHTDECYAWTETLTCEIPEGQVPEGGHVHTDECFEVTKELTCGQLEKHEHTDACFVLDGAGNRTGRPICGKTELLEHVHGEDCFTIEEREAEDEPSGPAFFQLFETEDLQTICGKEEHTHDDTCLNEAGEIVCGKEEHTHDESCLPADPAEPTAAPEESAAPDYVCGKEEHTHDDSCRDEAGELICGLEEHTHSESCLAPAPEDVFVKTWKDAGTLITARYTAEAQLPEDVVLQAYRVTPENDLHRYEERVEAAMDVLGMDPGTTPNMLVYSIGFYLPDGTEVEPQKGAAVTITIQFLDENGLPVGSPVQVVHFGEDGVETMEGSAVDSSNSTSFVTGSFSDFSLFLPPILDDLVISSPSGSEPPVSGSSDLAKFVGKVTIETEDGKSVEDGTLYVGEKYSIHLPFGEKGAQGLQFEPDEDGCLTYQIPSLFKADPREKEPLKVEINGVETEIGTYEIDENGKLTVHLNDVGKTAIHDMPNIQLSFDMTATAEAPKDGDDNKVHFGDTGEDFEFKVVDQPRVSVEKTGTYKENDPQPGANFADGGKLSYTVKTKVEHGQVCDVVIKDEMTPPDTDAFLLELEKVGEGEEAVPAVTVTVKDKDGNVKTLTMPDQYVLEELTEKADLEHPNNRAFKVTLLGDYQTLNEGDEVTVTYNYDVKYNSGSVDTFWGNVQNVAEVDGDMIIVDPEDPSKPPDKAATFHEDGTSNVEIFAVPPGEGIIFKTQEFTEADHRLHYTLYTVVPAGNWTPFNIQDDMAVEFGGKRYNLMEFKDGGRVGNLKVSAVDVSNGFNDWDDNTDDLTKIGDLEALKKQAHILTGYNIGQFDEVPAAAYKSNSVENYLYLWLNNNLQIVFGEWDQANLSGCWSYTKDRLIITEYDLDMSNDKGPLTLVDTSDYKTTIEKEASEVLVAGIRNTVHMRFDGYNPGYSVFFNNAEGMSKTGVLDKNTNTIEYTVTMNTTDTTVNKYFQDVRKDLSAAVNEAGWDAYYPKTMQAVFYDVLPEGWKYVDGSLAATARFVWGNENNYPYNGPHSGYPPSPVETEDGKQVIRAPLAFFFNEPAGNLWLVDAFSQDLIQLRFTYKLKATDEWMKLHATEPSVAVDNYAAIKDNSGGMHWEAQAHNTYIPQRLTKEAQQVGTSSLLRFTLQVNPDGIMLGSKEGSEAPPEYLIVTDESTGIQIEMNSIQVKTKDGEKTLDRVSIDDPKNLEENEWCLIPDEAAGKFELWVPNGVALTVSYNAQIEGEIGDNKPVSNKASIEGVDNSASSFQTTLKVTEISAGGSGSNYQMTLRKTDSVDDSKNLQGASFYFYLVRTEDSVVTEDDTIKIGETEYSCHMVGTYTTGEDGRCTIASEFLDPGNYYILRETGAPDGYQELEEPILIYYGAPGSGETVPEDVPVVPVSGTYTVADPPIPYVLPESGGSGLEPLYGVGIAMMALSAVLFLERDTRRRKRGDA